MLWSDYYIKFAEENYLFNAHCEDVIDIAKPQGNNDDTILKLSRDQGNSILMFLSNASNSMQFIHSISNLGRSTFTKEDKLVAIDGFDEPSASFPLIIQTKSLVASQVVQVPSLDSLTAITDK